LAVGKSVVLSLTQTASDELDEKKQRHGRGQPDNCGAVPEIVE